MTSREQFEAWWGGPRVQESFAERTFRNIAWDAWQASREEEIELPGACVDDEYFNDGVFQPMRYERDVERAILAAGFKVKGG